MRGGRWAGSEPDTCRDAICHTFGVAICNTLGVADAFRHPDRDSFPNTDTSGAGPQYVYPDADQHWR